MNKIDPLIRTKLHPPFIRPGLVDRSRLRERLIKGLRGPFTLIVAPAGFGKTTLVASSVSRFDIPIAWLSLDKNDNQTGRFLNYLVAALQEADPAIGSEAAQRLATSPPAPPKTLITNVINDLDILQKDMSLILDDYQFIRSQAIHDAVAFLLEHCPTNFHLVIATRSDPHLPLARLRARGQVTELRTADLRFTESETEQFLNDLMGLHLDAGSVAALEGRTEGWIVGLQMAALSMRDRDDTRGFIEGFSGTNRYILDYLLEEVLAREPKEVQTFLLETSILTRLTGPLCDAVTGASGGQEMLERLERRGLFIVPLDDERFWYRYHHLFADLLQVRLYQSEADRVARLLSRAAEWCEAEGQIAEAVDYALTARNFPHASDLIARYWHHIANRGEIETVWTWLKALPEDAIRHSAPLGLAYCWVLWLRGQIDAIEAHLTDAECALREYELAESAGRDDASYESSFPELSAHLAVLRSIVARYNNEFEAAVASAERALHIAPEALPPEANTQLRTVIFLALASACDGTGDLEKAVEAYTEAIHWSRLGTNPGGVTGMTHRLIGALWPLGRLRTIEQACLEALTYLEARGMARLSVAGILYLRMSEVLLEHNDLEAAKANLSRGVALGKRSGRFDAVRNAAPALVRMKLARQDASGALAAIQEAESALGEPPSSLAKAELLALRARIWIRQGALSGAVQCVEEALDLVGQDRGQIGERVALAASRLKVAQCKPNKAVAHLTRSVARAEDRGWMGVALELRILRSLTFARQGQRRQAYTDLERALAVAEPEGYVRIFLDEGQPMQRLLAQWLAHAEAGALQDYAIHLLYHFDTEPPKAAVSQEITAPTDDLVEPLSPRELEVLHLIALGSTNKEIGQQLVVATGTVKAHTSSIYRKLDVANRTEAVARARQLGILP